MIREMREGDWKWVSDIYRQGVERGNSTFNTECPSYEEWDTGHIKSCRFVCEKDKKVVGWIAVSPISGRCVYRGAVEVSIYIDEGCQGEGIGTALMEKLCSESREQGFWSLYSVIIAKNEASIALHKKCGFREIGYREMIAKDRFGEWQNTVLMERRNDIR